MTHDLTPLQRETEAIRAYHRSNPRSIEADCDFRIGGNIYAVYLIELDTDGSVVEAFYFDDNLEQFVPCTAELRRHPGRCAEIQKYWFELKEEGA